MRRKSVIEQDYRARATKAEQENARLREELARKPNFKWFLDQVRGMLKMPASCSTNDIVQKIKVLRDNQELYKSPEAVAARRDAKAHDDGVFGRGRKQGIAESMDALSKLRGAI